MKTISVAELGHGGASHAVRASQDEPVLVSKENRPAAWLLGAGALGQLGIADAGMAEAYEHALEVIAVDLYRREVITIGHAAKLAGMALGDFIDLCGKLQVPVLWEPERGLEAELEAAEALAGDSPRNG